VKPRILNPSGGFYWFQFEDPRIRAAVSTRLFDARFEEEAPGARRRLLAACRLEPRQTVGAEQVHGTTIQIIGPREAGRGALARRDAFPATDGFLTTSSGIALTIKTADCLPVFLCDPASGALALLHVGWRGARAGIMATGLVMMRGLAAGESARFEAVIGPCLRSEDYEVGPEFLEYFPGFTAPFGKEGRLHFDLPGYAVQELLKGGVREENILDTGLSTGQNTRSGFMTERTDETASEVFYSYRREGGQTGRMMSLLWREA